MRFTLIYDGPLKANADPSAKHAIRERFHDQLKILWSQQPLSRYRKCYDPNSIKRLKLNRPLGGFQFVPLVSKDLYLICELQIFMLRPEPPGQLFTQGGDIDNRLKTLFDALRMPTVLSELPKKAVVAVESEPFFCLLEDDNLITSVGVKTDRLLRAGAHQNEVHLYIQVETKCTQFLDENGLMTGGACLT